MHNYFCCILICTKIPISKPLFFFFTFWGPDIFLLVSQINIYNMLHELLLRIAMTAHALAQGTLVLSAIAFFVFFGHGGITKGGQYYLGSKGLFFSK